MIDLQRHTSRCVQCTHNITHIYCACPKHFTTYHHFLPPYHLVASNAHEHTHILYLLGLSQTIIQFPINLSHASRSPIMEDVGLGGWGRYPWQKPTSQNHWIVYFAELFITCSVSIFTRITSTAQLSPSTIYFIIVLLITLTLCISFSYLFPSSSYHHLL